MKKLIVKDPFEQMHDYMVIATMDDFLEYSLSLNDGVGDTCTRLLMSKVKPEKWDHMIARDGADAVVSVGIMAAKIKGASVFSEVGVALTTKLTNMANSLDGTQTGRKS